MATFDNLDTSAFDMYAVADEILVDEDGIDLKVDGEYVCAASFKDVDEFQLMHAVMRENFELPDRVTKEEWERGQQEILEGLPEASDSEKEWIIEQAEFAVRAALETLALVKGWEKP